MRKLLIALLLVSSVFLIAWALLPANQWLLSPEERTRLVLSQDIQKMMAEEGESSRFWHSLKDIKINYTEAALLHFIREDNLPLQIQTDGKYELHIQMIRWIEGHRYGLVVDFEIYDAESDNKVGEFGRTYHIGYIW